MGGCSLSGFLPFRHYLLFPLFLCLSFSSSDSFSDGKGVGEGRGDTCHEPATKAD